MPVSPLGKYLSDVSEIHRSGAGVPETSYYPAIRDLFNDVGKTLKPAVRCLVHLHNTGAGIPDGGLFTAQQLRGDPASSWDDVGLTPERGALEVKPPSDDVMSVALSTQVRSYLETYGLILVTNLREFVLVRRNGQGEPTILESFMLAPSEAEFWVLAAHPHRAANELEERFLEYLRRVMLAKAELASPKQVAWFLASYARDARARIEHADLQALTAVRTALESSLGLTFEGEKGDHFFRSTLIQTLFYGLFSAWVLWCRGHGDNEDFDWKDAQWSLHVPMIRALFEQVSQPGKLLPLHLVEPLDWAAGVLNRVDRAQFFTTFSEEQAVQYFYEPFLEEFDPVLRKDLGVWYTPDEIVRYQVERVDHVLRTELDIPRGFADPRVVVLDPCCGTGTYLVEVLRRIKHTLDDEGLDALSVQDVKVAAMTRIHGFEIMPAPFVVAHLQLGLLLTSMGAPLQNEERAGVYLTNSLTGWSPSPSGVHERTREELLFPEMTDERDAARNIKQEEQILVVLGNPPYNAFAGVHAEEEGDLVDCYKDGLNIAVQDGGWGIRKFNLDDLYVRFFRIAERRITEGRPGRGVVSYISNYSYLGDPSFVVMRKRLNEEFDAMWFDNMNGDSRATGKRTPDGRPDPSVFSTEYHSVGIKVGTAIATLVRTSPRHQAPTVYYRNFWGASKRQDLLESLTTVTNPVYTTALPSAANKYSFRPRGDTSTYDTWPKLTELCEESPSNGLMEKRGGALIDTDRSLLDLRMRKYYDANVSWNELVALGHPLQYAAAGFVPPEARQKALATERFDESRIRRYALRPFDSRWSYYTQVGSVWNRPRPTLWKQCWLGNSFLMSRVYSSSNPEGVPFFWTSILSDDHFLTPDASCFPLRLKRVSVDAKPDKDMVGQMFAPKTPVDEIITANLSTSARSYLALLDITDVDGNTETAGIVWMHALAVGFSPAYLTENADGIRQDWPRIPLPTTRALLQSSAALGKTVVALLDTEIPVDGVSVGAVRPELRSVGSLQVSPGHVLDPAAGDLGITAGWGHGGKDGVTMPGKGRLTKRDYSAPELEAIEAGAGAIGITLDDALALLGRQTYDVWLDDLAFWQNVPVNVWNYVIGGYQVIKKWLSYRERTLLGRDLTIDEARYVTEMVRRLSALILLQPQLDENYHAVAAATTSFRAADTDFVGPTSGVVAGDTPARVGGTE